MKKLKCWKKNQKSNYPARWDNIKNTHVVVVNKIHHIKSMKPFKFEEVPKFEAMHSHATGGWHSISVEKTEQEAIKKAIKFMKDSDSC